MRRASRNDSESRRRVARLSPPQCHTYVSHTTNAFTAVYRLHPSTASTSTAVCEMLRPSLSRPPRLFVHHRSYALSRFPDCKPVGAGRRRTPSPLQEAPRNSAPENPYGLEDRPSAEESPLWSESQIRTGDNPEEGLRHLLFESDTLVVTR